MSLLPLVLSLLVACWGDNAYIVEGTVVEVRGAREVVVDHGPIKGLMGPMVMPFTVADGVDTGALRPGDRIIARLMLEENGSSLDRIRVTGYEPPPAVAPQAPLPLRVGEVLSTFRLQREDGSELILGEGQAGPVLFTFLYTRCPMPEFCPLTVNRLQAVQKALEGLAPAARLVAITLDPAHDTPEVLAAFAQQVGADPARWTFAVAGPDDLRRLAALAALQVNPGADGAIEHGTRWLVLDEKAQLVARYDDQNLPIADVVKALGAASP
jgi:protein SCO1/2